MVMAMVKAIELGERPRNLEGDFDHCLALRGQIRS